MYIDLQPVTTEAETRADNLKAVEKQQQQNGLYFAVMLYVG